MSRRRVLVDRHQADLLHSLQLLFEDRLGFDLYVPVGHEWWSEGIWRFGQVYGDARLADQFLSLDATWRASRDRDFHVTFDKHHPLRQIRGVTLEQARAARSEWAFVVASVPDNEKGFKAFADQVGARYVVQVGNNNQQVDWSLDPLALVSTSMPIAGRGVRYHQEFDTRNRFVFTDPLYAEPRTIASFVNCMPTTSCWPQLQQARALLPDWRFGIYGIDGEDGNVSPIENIVMLMTVAQFAWHDKPHGDGFGHVIHDWAAIGRPLVGHASNYAGLLAEPLWEDGVTCVSLDGRSVEEACSLLRSIAADSDRYAAMCHAIRARFDSLVDFDRDELAIRELLGL